MKEHCTLTRVYRFSAGHRLYNPDYTEEENWRVFGKCTNPRGHGHDYTVEVTVCGRIDDETGMIIDINTLDRIVGEVLEELDHKRLDIEVPYFTEHRASGEIIARYLWERLSPRVASSSNAALCRVTLWETPNNYFEYYTECRRAEEV